MLMILKKVSRRLFCKIKNEIICYRAKEKKIFYLNAKEELNTVKRLPADLIITPGQYRWEGKVFDLEEEGLYRFVLPEKKNAQRIVFFGDADVLLSSIAWIVSHGNRDDAYTDQRLVRIAKTDKLYLTCERVSRLASFFLSKYGIPNRIIFTEERTFSSSYDAGHVMLEVWQKKWNQWVLYDLDKGVFFKKNQQPLSLIEFMENVYKEEYDIEFIAQDTPIDLSGFEAKNGFKYHFLMEAVQVDLKAWYLKVCQVASILEEGKRYYFVEGCKHPHESNIVLNEKCFMDKFY